MKTNHFYINRILTVIALLLVCAIGWTGCNNTDMPHEAALTSGSPEPNTSQITEILTEAGTTMQNNETQPPVVSTAGAGYLLIPDTVARDGKTDVTDEIQQFINDNPNRTIFFPDGTYLISRPITTPAKPSLSVSLLMSDYAVIKASGSWRSNEAMIRLGGQDAFNDTSLIGSNYSLVGGVIDGSGVAKGISIDSGRETAVRNVSLKNVKLGLHIKFGANSGSSDADISNINIIGTGTTDSVGILIEGYDNTLTNIRIGHVFVGVRLRSQANMLRNIHPLYYSDYTNYTRSCGFIDEAGNNWYDFCYSDQFGVAFRLSDGITSYFHNCYCYWYTERGDSHTAFYADGAFNSIVTIFKAGFRNKTDNRVLFEIKSGGTGVFEHLIVENRDKLQESDAYTKHLD